MSKSWFEVDRQGLASLMDGRGKEFVLYELLQNALDEDTTAVHLTLIPVAGRALCDLQVEDDSPEGFRDLAHAFTLFAPSAKKGDATKRGRFNLGEKMVLALCESASITSTTGTVFFTPKGRSISQVKRLVGTMFNAQVRMTRAEYEDVCRAMGRVILSEELDRQEVFFNGERIQPRTPVASKTVTLPTVIDTGDGTLRPTQRQVVVELFRVYEGETATLYELGIPVVETGDRWHVNIRQKVPLNLDRDNVTPAFLRKVRGIVLDMRADLLGSEEAARPWVAQALEEPGLRPETINQVLSARFGEHRAVYDPSDREATSKLASEGYSIIHGSVFSKAAWENIRAAGAAKPAGQISPTPRPFTPGGRPLEVVAPEDYTPSQERMVVFAKRIAKEILGVSSLQVVIANDSGWGFRATYGVDSGLILNFAALHAEFEDPMGPEMLGLLIHEFGHHYGSDHLSAEYHKGLCRVGAKLALWMSTTRFVVRENAVVNAPR